MKPRNAYRTILGLCFVLLFGVAAAQQSRQSAEPKYIAAGSPGWRVTGDDTLGAFFFSESIMQPARFVFVASPAGLEKFFAERTALGKEIPTTDPSYAGRYKALTDKYGLEYSSDWSFPPMAKN
jgi:hypothetical protein